MEEKTMQALWATQQYEINKLKSQLSSLLDVHRLRCPQISFDNGQLRITLGTDNYPFSAYHQFTQLILTITRETWRVAFNTNANTIYRDIEGTFTQPTWHLGVYRGGALLFGADTADPAPTSGGLFPMVTIRLKAGTATMSFKMSQRVNFYEPHHAEWSDISFPSLAAPLLTAPFLEAARAWGAHITERDSDLF